MPPVTPTYKETKREIDEKDAEGRVLSFDIVNTSVASSVGGSCPDVQDGSDDSTTSGVRRNYPSTTEPGVRCGWHACCRVREATAENSLTVTIEQLDGILLQRIPAPQLMVLYDLCASQLLGQPPLELDWFPSWRLRPELYDGASKMAIRTPGVLARLLALGRPCVALYWTTSPGGSLSFSAPCADHMSSVFGFPPP
ncbi:hypothetical protein BS47DRAFT_109261 [Hydnum rufescens UP504]|uniref:Uncharacterized protein n=1 Tax=Hydnum rufescens UP504 TaxID=1448309 RepID=A0A9P6AQ73_9AGAM|nr:hypothetical protein BS47DRAFT_109261 [Hydnum rufescens UP504]